MASARYSRRAIKRKRKTISVYVLPSVVAEVDALVDAFAELGAAEVVRKAFVGFQRYLYHGR